MLPVIKISTKDIFVAVEDFMEPGKINISVQTFAYDFTEFKKGLESKNENADRLMSKTILVGMMQKQFKSKIMFFYSPYSEYTFISAALLKLNSNLNWLRNIPGYSEYGQENLKPNARPFLYWDGDNLHRIYYIPDYEPSTSYINDFGSLYGLLSSDTDPDTYNRVKLNKANKTWDYSIVPDEHEEIITVKNKKLVLLHSRYELINE